MKRPMTGVLIAATGCGLFVMTLAAQDAGPSEPQDAASYKALMDDAADLQYEVMDALDARQGAKAATAAAKLEALMAQSERYWTKKNATDAVKLAQTAKALATKVATAADAGKLTDANEAFARLKATCNACHDLQLEKR